MKLDQLERLFRKMEPGRHPKPADDEFEFKADLKRLRVLDRIDFAKIDLFAPRECVRVQTSRMFEERLTIDLPDTSTDILRPLRCEMTMRGAIPANENDARRFVEAALAHDFKFGPVVGRIIDEATEAQRTLRGGKFFAALRSENERKSVEAAFVAALRAGGIPLETCEIRPILSDRRARIVIDETNGVMIRTPDRLDKKKLGFKAALVWGGDDLHKIARLAYHGSTADDGAPRPLAKSFVFGQVEPLGAWLRQLVAEVASETPWENILTNGEDTRNEIAAKVSEKLGRGTGRIIETLELLAIAGGAAGDSGSLVHTQTYDIADLKQGGITVKHTVNYDRVDPDRWQAQGSPDAQEFLRPYIDNVCNKFFQTRRYDDIIGLYRSAIAGEDELTRAIEHDLRPRAQKMGHDIVSVAAFFDIPHKGFVDGQTLRIRTRDYSFSEGYIAAPIAVVCELHVGEEPADGIAFSRASALATPIEEQIDDFVHQELAAILREQAAYQYYTSRYASSISSRLSTEPQKLLEGRQGFDSMVRDALSQRLRSRFGLVLDRLDIQPGKEDRYVERLEQLKSLMIHVDPIRFEFLRGDSGTSVEVKGFGSIQVLGLVPDRWDRFYPQVAQKDSSHVDEIRTYLINAVRRLETLVGMARPADIHEAEISRMLEDYVKQALRERCGLDCEVEIVLTLRWPRIGGNFLADRQRAERLLSVIYNEMEEIIKGSTKGGMLRLKDLSDYEAKAERLSERIKQMSADEEANIESVRLMIGHIGKT